MRFTGMMFFGSDGWAHTHGATLEECLKDLVRCTEKTITYRPCDRTLYVDFSHIPCGVIFTEEK